MDYQEAIKHFENKINTGVSRNRRRYYEIAISAMQELQAIHNNGISLERLKNIDFRKQVIEHINYMDYMDIKDELEEYKQLGTLEEVREAVERQQAKKPVVGADVMVGRDDDGNPIWENDYECAECGMGIEPEYVCCPYCETVIDWSEEI